MKTRKGFIPTVPFLLMILLPLSVMVWEWYSDEQKYDYVLVPTVDIAKGTELNGSHLEIAAVKDMSPEDKAMHYFKEDKLVGKVAKEDLKAKRPITKENLEEE